MATNSYKDFGIVLPNLVESIIEHDNKSLIDSANSIDSMIDSGDFPKKHEFFGIFYAALAYDIANEQFDAERLYKTLFDSKLPDLSHLVSSDTDSEILSSLFGHIGLREFSPFDNGLSGIVTHLQTKNKFEGESILEQDKDDYVVLFSVLSLLRNFLKAINERDSTEIQNILNITNKFYQEVEKFDPESWIELITNMYLELIRRISERSIISLDISEKMKQALYNQKIAELWIPQKQVIELGLLKNQSILFSSPPGTGKSFLAYMTTGKLTENKQTIYLVPSRSLSSQVYDDLNKVLGSDYKIAVSDRDRTEDDEYVHEKDVVVATYEKMDALLRRKKLSLSNIQTVIVDEIQYLGDEKRGMTLELMLTKFMQHENPIQIIGLSGLLSKENSEQLANWMKSRNLQSDWRGVKTDETIFFEGKLYHKNGIVEDIQIPSKRLSKVYDKKKFITSHFAKRAIAKKEPILISVNKRDTAANLSYELREFVSTFTLFDNDLIDNLDKNQQKYQEVINQIKSIEAELPEFAQQLVSMLKFGIVYHHAGLPVKYRKIIETAIKKNSVDIIIATPTLDAGMNLPIKTVLFFDPKFYDGTWQILENRRYRNVSGRAGRPGFHRTANVVVIANNLNELNNFKEQFWYSDLEPILSSFYNIIKDSKYSISSLSSHLLSFIDEHKNSSLNSIKNNFTHTWFWKQSLSEINTQAIMNKIEIAIELLKKYDFISLTIEGGYTTTTIGSIVNESMMLPDSAYNTIKCIEHLFTTEYNDEEIINMILILSGFSTELYNYQKIIKDVTIPNPISSMKEKFQNIEELFLDPQNLEFSLKCASLLYYWINSFTMKQIMEFSNLGSQSNSALIEENLIKDVYRILLGIYSIAESVRDNESDFSSENTEKILGLIKTVAEFCNDGTRNKVVKTILHSGVNHMGRTTALKLNNYLESQQKNLLSLSENEFKNIFPDNRDVAKTLYDEIHEIENYFIIQNSN